MPSTAFAARTLRVGALPSGLRSGLSLHHPPESPGIRCCPSSLYTFPAGVLLRAWLGIAISGFPEFEQFCIAGFPSEHSSFLKSAASAIPPRPRGKSSAVTYHRAGGLNLHLSLRNCERVVQDFGRRHSVNKLFYSSQLIDWRGCIRLDSKSPAYAIPSLGHGLRKSILPSHLLQYELFDTPAL